MTTADAIDILECKLMIEAINVADNHDYNISCNDIICRIASDLFALQMVNDHPECDVEIPSITEYYEDVPIPTPINTEEDCSVNFIDSTQQTNCPPMIIIQG